MLELGPAPCDLEAEESLLGAMMLESSVIPEVLAVIPRASVEWLSTYDHQKLFGVLVEMYDADKPIDLIAVRNELKARDLADRIPAAMLAGLAEAVGNSANAQYYARIVRDKGVLRHAARAAIEIVKAAHEKTAETADVLELVERTLYEVTDYRTEERTEPFRGVLAGVFESLKENNGGMTGTPTGFVELDDILCGLQPGELIIAAARPSMGKTAFGLNVAEHVACRERKNVLIFSLEMNERAIVQRMLCANARVDSHRMRRGFLNDQEFDLLKTAAQTLDCGLLLHAPWYASVFDVRTVTRRAKIKQGVDLVIVDYLQLLRGGGKHESRQQEVAEISRQLKGLAENLDIPVLAMAQLNRQSEMRSTNRPRMSDLRESGAIEQDADVVLLLHREEYYAKNPNEIPESIQGIAEVIVAKQRNGPTGTVRLHFNSRFSRFDNLAHGAGENYEQAITQYQEQQRQEAARAAQMQIPF